MLVNIQNTTSKIESHICEFHKQHPLEQYAGCTCSCSYSSTIVPTINKNPYIKDDGTPDWELARKHILDEYHDVFSALANM